MSTASLNGEALLSLFTNGYRNLKQNAETVDALNVFPIPDGDTGKNMSMTWLGGLENSSTEEVSIEKMAKAFSKGTLLAARGNSGVILSQFVRGLMNGMKGHESITPEDFVLAMESGYTKAYSAVSVPTEGTMLTVMRETADSLKNNYDPFADFELLFDEAVKEMKKSLMNTPNLLACLKEAGVVDSGGAGLLYLFEGMQMALHGEMLDGNEQSKEAPEEFFTPDSVRKAMKKSTMFHTKSKLAKAPNITITPAEQMR